MTEENNNKIENSILIAGGYGVVGRQIAEAIRANHPELPIVIAGRHPEKGQALADSLGSASVLSLNMEQANPLKNSKPRAVLAAVNDPNNYLLIDAIQKGIPYLDITRWTERLREAVEVAKKENLKAPVMFSSGWMAGVAAVVARELTKETKAINNIDISVLYSLKDKAGPNSTEYMDHLSAPFEVTINGKSKQVYPYTDPKMIIFPSGHTAKAYRFDTPDQFTLPKTTNAKTVSARIAFDDAISTWLLVILTRSGLWKLIGGEHFKSLRQSILFNPGKGAKHEIVVEAEGTVHTAKPVQLRATVLAPEGQAHLAAVGAAIQLDRLLGMDGAPAPKSSIVFPDTAPQTNHALSVLRAFGIEVKIESLA